MAQRLVSSVWIASHNVNWDAPLPRERYFPGKGRWDQQLPSVMDVAGKGMPDEASPRERYFPGKGTLTLPCGTLISEGSALGIRGGNASIIDASIGDRKVSGLEGDRKVSALDARRHHAVSAELLSRKWGIGLDTAKRMLEVTTQRGIQSAVHPLSRRYRTDILQTRLRRLNTTFYTDMMFSTVKSLKGNSCTQVFTNGRFIKVVPMSSKAQAGEALDTFQQDVGITDRLIFDGAQEHLGPSTDFMKNV